MKRIIKRLLVVATMLVSSCGSNNVKLKLKCEYYRILDSLLVECHLRDNNYNAITWYGNIDKWIVDINDREIYWYEMENDKHYIKYGIHK